MNIIEAVKENQIVTRHEVESVQRGGSTGLIVIRIQKDQKGFKVVAACNCSIEMLEVANTTIEEKIADYDRPYANLIEQLKDILEGYRHEKL